MIVINDVIETEKLKKKVEEVQNPEEAAKVIQEYENISWTKKEGIICIAYYQGKVFKKFKDKEKFIKLVNAFKVHKTTIIFKINIFSYVIDTLN